MRDCFHEFQFSVWKIDVQKNMGTVQTVSEEYSATQRRVIILLQRSFLAIPFVPLLTNLTNGPIASGMLNFDWRQNINKYFV
jgi:hypothetical protein